MNFIYLSPNFPDNHWYFCRRLRDDGVNVLGIGDCPYDELRWELRDALNEYYWVPSLEDYDAVYRAVAYFIHSYGRIDYLESNNEYWLERDAALRRDFHITSGFQPEDMPQVKFKSRMKERYALGGIPVARHHMVRDREGCAAFIAEVGWPVIVKPDNGVGAISTFRISSEEDLNAFFARKDDTTYIMEEYIDGTICSYDAIVNSRGEVLFEGGTETVGSIMDLVNEQGNCRVMVREQIPDALRQIGRATVRAFGVKKRMIHFEFFRLNRDQRIGKAGDFAALEVNMRPCGGILPSMLNYAYSTDVYQIWADMIVFDQSRKPIGQRRYCVLAGRRDKRSYWLSRAEVLRRFAGNIVEEGRVDPALATDMGDYLFLACFPTEAEAMAFFDSALAER